MITDMITNIAGLSSFGVTPRPMITNYDSFPAVTYTLSREEKEVFYNTETGREGVQLTLDLYHDSYSSLQAMKDELIDTYHNFKGTVGSTFISHMELTSSLENIEQRNPPIYRCIMLFQIYY